MARAQAAESGSARFWPIADARPVGGGLRSASVRFRPKADMPAIRKGTEWSFY